MFSLTYLRLCCVLQVLERIAVDLEVPEQPPCETMESRPQSSRPGKPCNLECIWLHVFAMDYLPVCTDKASGLRFAASKVLAVQGSEASAAWLRPR